MADAMPDPVQPLAIPPAVTDYLRELIRLRFTGRDPQPVLDALPRSMPAGTVQPLAWGGPFGWYLSARLDVEADGRLALEALEDDRMSGPCHYRIWEDGTREALPNEHIGYGYPTGAPPEVVQRARDANAEHNRAVQEGLRERGFL
jgi:hypothetical protein